MQNTTDSQGSVILDPNEPKNYRVILRKEDPETDIHNEVGIFRFRKKDLLFSPNSMDHSNERVYRFEDLVDVQVGSVREWFKQRKVTVLHFVRKNVSVDVFIEPVDVTPEFLLQEITQHKETITKGSLSGIVGSLIEKIGTESQKIVREVGVVLETTSRELTHLTQATSQFIREATKTANLLDVDPSWSKKETIKLEISEIDEILKRSLASGKLDAMISGLIAKALVSAKDQRFKEARDALQIARDAAQNAEMKEYAELVEENMKEIDSVETTEIFNPHLNEKALKYANEARDIVAEWETEETPQEPA